MYIKVQETVLSKNLGGYDPNESYSVDSSESTHYIDGISIVDDAYFGHFKTDINVVPNKPYMLLYVIYDSGDSFSTHSGLHEYISLHENPDIIADNISKINASYETRVDNYSVELSFDNGKKFKQSCSWVGHFERFHGAHFKTVFIVSKS